MPTYFLTGANRGLGLEFVRQLSAERNNTIIAAVRSSQSDLSDLSEATSSHANVHIVECDTGSSDSIARLSSSIPQALRKAGDAKIDYLLNNAGINATSSDTSMSIDPVSLQNHISTNVLGPAKIVETLRPYLAKGAIIMNMTSGLGSLTVATQITKCCTYSISKAALNMLTVHQAKDLKGEAIVICMDPGWVKTRMGGEGAILEPHVSVGGMLDVVHRLSEEDSPRFFRYDGSQEQW